MNAASQVPLVIAFVAKVSAARRAVERAHAGVYRPVAAQVRRRREALAAHLTPVLVDAAVHVHVLLQARRRAERLLADRAAERPQSARRAVQGGATLRPLQQGNPHAALPSPYERRRLP